MAKSKQRGHGEGSIYQRKDGRWVAQITLEDGKRKQLYGKTRREASEKLDKARLEQKQGRLATGPQQKLKDYLEQWLEEVHRPTVRLSSYLTYRGLFTNHILPALGHIQIQKLTEQKVQSFYTSKLNEGLSPSTIHIIHGLLHKALGNAVRWKLANSNACDGVSVPRYVARKVQPLTPEQARHLLQFIKGHELEALITLALTTGMRHGELTALQWSDINFEERSLSIQRTVRRLGRYKYREGEPKTEQSRRKIVLPSFVVETLKAHRIRQKEARLKAGAKWQERNLVFCNTQGGFSHPDRLLEKFREVLEEAGLPRMRLHDLRHSAATILLSMGVNAKVVQEILGHSQVSMTLGIYSHVLPSMQDDAMGKWNDLFGG